MSTPLRPGEMRRLLVIAFHYLPDNTSTGVLRTLKFTDYLRAHGWRSDVVTVPERMYRSVDPESVQRIPEEVSVHRPWARSVKELFGLRGIYPDLLALPDRFWPWLPGAVRMGLGLAKEKDVEAIYSTFPPATAHLIGLRLKRKTGLPWIADFRDPWVEDSMPPVRHRLEGWLEQRVLTSADRVICNTPAMRRWFLEHYPSLPEERFVTIPNGYDEPDFQGIVPEARPSFEILYPGMISGGNRNPRPLLAGIALALERGWLDRSDLQITFLGTGPYGARDRFREELAEHYLEDLCEVQVQRIPYSQAVARMAGADLLVVLSEPLGSTPEAATERAWSHLQVPAKVYEYLRLGRPLLALVSGGAVAELLEETGAGSPVPPEDEEGVAAVLREAYANRKEPGVPPEPPAGIDRYSREHQAAELAAVLEGCTAPAAAPYEAG